MSSLALSKNLVLHNRSKHIDVRFHFIRNAIEENIINLDYIRTDLNLADMLTKAIPKPRFLEHLKMLGIIGNTPKSGSVVGALVVSEYSVVPDGVPDGVPRRIGII